MQILIQGADLGFQVRGGAHLKKMRRAEGGAKMFWVFPVKNHDFTQKNPILGRARVGYAPRWIPPLGTIFAESPSVQTCDLPTACMQRINSGLPSGDMVYDANAMLHSSSAASLGGSNDMNTILGAWTSATQCFSNLQETVTQLLKSQQKEKQLYDVNGFNLQQWYSNTPAIPNPQPPENTVYQGVRSDSYTNVDIVSPNLQKQIIEGKDINLASLLIHN